MSANSTRTDLFGIFVLAGRPLTASQVIALAQPLRISATNVKSHLSRLVGEGALYRSGARRFARYWPSHPQRQVIEGVAARLDVREESWDGRWIMLVLRGSMTRSERRAVREALWFDGFRPWGTETYMRPAWPRSWALERARFHLANRSGLSIHGTFVGTVDMQRVARMYDVDLLNREAMRLTSAITGRCRGKVSAAQAFADRLRVGGRVARLIAHDPRLPQSIWGARTGTRNLKRAYRRYESFIGPSAKRFVAAVLADEIAKR